MRKGRGPEEGEHVAGTSEDDAAPGARASDREHLLGQLREANERLVLAMLDADELVEKAVAARLVAADTAAREAAARRSADHIAAQLREREGSLRASESEAQSSNRAKDEFVAMLAHELRNPLAPMLTALDLIAMDPADAHKREHAVIARQVAHLVRLVDDLLDVSRIRNNKIELQREPVELARVVARAVELAAAIIAAKAHTLAVDVPDRGLVVDGDVIRLAQIVANLLTNAAKYTPPGGSIVVTGERRGATIALRVRDNGIGIASEMLPQIFELFAQERAPLGRSVGGLGLGLAIVRSLVEMHGGTVAAHSEGRNLGSEFVVELPAAA